MDITQAKMSQRFWNSVSGKQIYSVYTQPKRLSLDPNLEFATY